MLLDGIPILMYDDDMKPRRTDLADVIRKAMKHDGRTVYAVARDAKLPVSMIQRFHKGGGLNTDTASKLCDLFGLELRPIDVKGR